MTSTRVAESRPQTITTRVASPAFVGRGAELAQLEGALTRAAAGEPAVALIGGESGVGKSRLVTELIARAHASGTRVLAGDCVALGDTELPYAPIVAALRSLERHEVEAIAGPAAPGLAPLLPQLGELPGAATAGALAQGRLFELLLALLGRLAGDGEPLLLVIEDLHWADRSTRDFLAFLIRTSRRERIALVATYRTDELHRRHPLRSFLAEAERAPAVTRVAVPRFAREELRAQLEGILGRRPEARLVDDLFARAEGNPFYTEELVAAGDHLPENVRDTLMMRIEALSPDAQTVLRMVATAGPRVRHGLLVRVLELPPDALLAALREAVVHHVLVQDPATDAYTFRHALQREAITDDLLPGERGPLHGALAGALTADPSLSASGGVAAELAFHWAAALNLPAAFTASCEAGAEAARLAAFSEANAHYERAAELFDAVPAEQRETTRVELLRRAAESAYLAANTDRAVALIRRALAEVDDVREPMIAALAYERLGRYLWVDGMSADALEALRTAVALLPADGPPADRARVLGSEGHLLMLVGHPAEAAARCEQALPLARTAGACAEAAGILNTLGATMVMQGRFDDATAAICEARDIAEELHDLEELSRSYVNLGQTLDSSGHLEEAANVAREGAAMCEREGIAGTEALLATELSSRLMRLGHWDEAGRLTDDLIDRTLSGVHRSGALAARGHLDALQGHPEKARVALDEAERTQRQAAGAMWTAPVAIGRAEAALWAGDPREAARVVHAELATYTAQDDDPIFVPPVLCLGARAEADLAAAGDPAAAERAAALLRRMRCLLGVKGAASTPETLLHGAWAEAEAERAAGRSSAPAWAELAARWDEFGLPYHAACARWREAEAELTAGGDRDRVKAALTVAREIARRLGATPLQSETETLAQRARITLGAVPVGTDGTAERLGLTDRELAVLQHLAAGESNREIGELLFISHKTVSVHVSRILTKLDARTRTEATSRGHRLGLLENAAA